MAKIRHTIGVIGVTLCLCVVIYGQGSIYDVARKDALEYVAKQGVKPPSSILGMVSHSGKGNGKGAAFPYKLPPAPPGYAYYEFYAPFTKAFNPKAKKGQRRVILALRRTDGRVHPTWYWTTDHYDRYNWRVTHSLTK